MLNDNVIREIVAILKSVPEYEPGHHLRRPFMTSYQLAIELEKRNPKLVADLGFPIGGEGVGEHQSLAQQIARHLSQEAGKEPLQNIEGGFLSHQNLSELVFKCGVGDIRSSTIKAKKAEAIFRYVDQVKSEGE